MTELEIHRLSNYAQWFGSFLIAIFSFLLLTKRPKEVAIIGLYGIVSFIFSLLQFLFLYFEINRVNAVGNVYVLFEACILLFLFYLLLKNNSIRQIIRLFAVGYLVFYFLIITNDITYMTSPTRAVRDVLMIICSIIYFFFLLRELPEEKLTELPMFWINSAILFFFSCTFMLSLSLTYLQDVLKDSLTEVWAFRNFLRFIFCLIICYGIWKVRKRSQVVA